MMLVARVLMAWLLFAGVNALAASMETPAAEPDATMSGSDEGGAVIAPDEGADDAVPDADMIGWAKEACAADGFNEFFDLFARSEAVRQQFLAPEIAIGSLKDPGTVNSTVKKADYRDFNITLVDYLYTDAKSFEKFISDPSAGLEDLQVEFSDLPDRGHRVDYVKAEFENVGEEEQKLLRTYGAPGAYVFAFRDGCWQMTQDLR